MKQLFVIQRYWLNACTHLFAVGYHWVAISPDEVLLLTGFRDDQAEDKFLGLPHVVLLPNPYYDRHTPLDDATVAKLSCIGIAKGDSVRKVFVKLGWNSL